MKLLLEYYMYESYSTVLPFGREKKCMGPSFLNKHSMHRMIPPMHAMKI